MEKRKILIHSSFLATVLFLSSCGAGIDYNPNTQELTVVPGNAIQLGILTPNTITVEQLDAQAKQLQAAGDDKKANNIYQKIVADFPSSAQAPEAQFRIAEYLNAKGKRSKAFDVYQNVINNYLSTPLYKTSLDRQITIAHDSFSGRYKTKAVFLRTKVPAERIDEMLKQVISNAPQAPSAPESLYLRGQLLEREKRTSQAVQVYRNLSQNYPESNYSGESLFRVGSILFDQTQKSDTNLDNFKNALLTFEELKTLYPRHAKIPEANQMIARIEGHDIKRSLEIAQFYEKKRQFPSALFYYNEILSTTKKGSEYHNLASSKIKAITTAPAE